MEITPAQIIEKLHLAPLPDEGGRYIQTYISDIVIKKEHLAARYNGDRAISTQIYFLLTDEDDDFSALHKLLSDEVYHFYLGDPVEMLMLHPDGRSEVVILGQDILHDEKVQYVVRRGIWQGSHIKPGGKFALLGTTMSPAFDVADFQLGDRLELIKKYPHQKDLISKLTR